MVFVRRNIEIYVQGMSNLIQHTTELAMHIAKEYIRPSGLVIDATCGNGHDTLTLAKVIWPIDPGASLSGTDSNLQKAGRLTDGGAVLQKAGAARLLAFDVQKAAIESTRTALIEAGFGAQMDSGQIVLIQDDHANMAEHINVLCGWSADDHANTADPTTGACLVVFNLGYLPGGGKQITTESASTLRAVEAALDLLSKDGLICITMYSGHEAGAKEKQALLAFAEELDSRIFHAAYINMINQANDPPEILLISRKC